ncbi:MAG: hypothetical protein V8Q69_12735 [Bacteroides caccae]
MEHHFAINVTAAVVNLDFNPLLLERVNKYLESFKADSNAENAYDDALLFCCDVETGIEGAVFGKNQ